MHLININDAAALSGKSIQTIRRMIKHKKIQVRRQKTPQGFNYLIIKESLLDYIHRDAQAAPQDTSTTQISNREHRPITPALEDHFKTEVERFNTTIQKLIAQNERDKENFFQLVKTFQDRVVSLENQIKLLEAPRKRWFRFWR